MMDGKMPAGGSGQAGTAVSRFKCTPLSDAQRIFAYDLGGYHHK